MATRNSDPTPGPLDFLKADPTPVAPGERQAMVDPADILSPATADRLLAIEDVVGAWIERDAQGRRLVCVHVSRPGGGAGVPKTVDGMSTRLVGHAPIKAGL